MHYRKPNRPRFLLPLVALLAIFAISIGFTYSWIEGGATYTIQSDDENQPIKTDSVPDNITYSGKITLNPSTSSGTITLVNYDENTNQYQDLYFSPVSSVDGETFYFPVMDIGGNKAFYRESNINDIGTKFINYDFDVNTEKKCYLAFDGMPTISASKTNGERVTDTSAFRIMIKCGGEKYFFTTATENKTSTVVTGISGSEGTLTAVPFTAFLNNTNKTAKLISYEKGATDNIEVSVWLDDGSDTSALEGCEITINLKLIVVAEDVNATFDAVTYNKTGTKVNNGFAGGNIKYDSVVYTNSFTKTGTSFKATANANSGYEFMGWYSDKDCTQLVEESNFLPEQTPDDDVTYYAKFQERNVTTIYVESRSGFLTYSIWAYQKFGTDTHHYSGTEWPGESATLDSTTGYYKYEFTTTDTGQFSIIISNDGGSQYPAQNDEGLLGNIGGTYLFTADNKLIEFDPADMIIVNAYGSSGGGATVNGVANVKIRPGESIAIKATPNTNYKFVSWYTDDKFTTQITTNPTTASQTITLTDADAGKTLNYYAKFEKIPTLTLKTSVTPTGGGKAYVNSNTSITAQIGSSVKLSATANSGYKFVGWYTNSACTTTTGITNPTSATGATYTVSGTANSTVTLYAKFEKSAKMIYFTPSSNWESSGSPRYAMYVFNDSTNTHQWVSMTEIGTSNVFQAELPEGDWQEVIFCRMNPSTTENNWNQGVKWNQTGDLTLPTDGKNYFKFTSSSWDNGTTGTWSTYTG